MCQDTPYNLFKTSQARFDHALRKVIEAYQETGNTFLQVLSKSYFNSLHKYIYYDQIRIDTLNNLMYITWEVLPSDPTKIQILGAIKLTEFIKLLTQTYDLPAADLLSIQ